MNKLGLSLIFVLSFVLTSGQSMCHEQEGVPGYVLLHNGGLFQGMIHDYGKKITVTTKFGHVDILKKDIEFLGENLTEIYDHKKQNISTSYESMNLAEWCHKNHLKAECEKEYDRAIELAESPSMAAEMRRRKERLLERKEEEQGLKPLVESLSVEEQELLDWERRIPNSILTRFSEQVQPLLLKRCSGLACHSPGTISSYQLQPLKNPKDKVNTLKNLSETLKYLDRENSVESPLLQVPIGPHGKAKKIFNEKSFSQYEILYFWAFDAVEKADDFFPEPQKTRNFKSLADLNAELNKTEFPKSGIPLLKKDQNSVSTPVEKFSLADGFLVQDHVKTEKDLKMIKNDENQSPFSRVDQVKTEAMMELEGNDPFDPSTFNQQFHPNRVSSPTGL